MKNNILFFDVCNPAYIPLIKAVYERGYPLVMNGCGLRDHLQEMGIRLLPFEGFVATDIQSHVQTATVDTMTKLAQALQMPGVKGEFSSPLGDFLSHTGQAFFQNLSSLIGAEIWAIEAFESLVSRCQVSLVVLGCDNSPVQRALVKAADGFKIRTLHLAHGIPTKSCYGVAGEMADLYANFLASFGEIHRARLTENDVSRERIFLTGSPLWDPLYSQGVSMSKEHACRALELNPDCPVVLFCTSGTNGSSPYFPGKCRNLFALHQAVLQAVHRIGPEVQLLVRPHPNEIGRAYYSEGDLQRLDQAYQWWAVTRHQVNVRVIRDKKIESILAADLVITIPSNVISEVMILQRPVMAIPLSSEEGGMVNEEHQGTQVIYDKEQIYPMLRELLDNPSRREEVVKRQNAVLPDVNYGHDGNATDRVAALVEQLATPTLTDAAQSSLQSQKQKPLRIVLAVHNFPPYSYAGTELYTYELAKVLQKQGHRVTILYPMIGATPQDTGQLNFTSYDELPIVQLALSPSQIHTLRNEEIQPAIRKYFLEHPVDVVHIQHLMGLSTSFVEVLEELNIPVVFTANDFWFFCQQIHLVEPSGMVCTGPETIDKCVQCINSHRGPFSKDGIQNLFHYIKDRLDTYRQTLTKVDLVLCPSRFLLNMFRTYKCEGKRMVHAPQGAALFTPMKPPSISQTPLVFSYLGTISYRKGFDILIDAINQVDVSNAEFRIYGTIVEPEYFGKVMQSVRGGKQVTFYGPYKPKDLPRILSQTHIAVVPSRGENYPFVIREMLHGGIPVIASSIAGIPEIVRDEENGLLFQMGSVSDLSKKLERVIHNPGLIDELRSRIQPVKSIEQEAVELEKHYASVIRHLQDSTQLLDNPLPLPVVAPNRERTGKDDGLHRESKSGEMHGQAIAVSIIIPVHNKVDLTQQCLIQLAQITMGVTYEVIIVDNASTDETTTFLSSLSGDVQIIRNDENLGFAKANNQGARVAKGKHLVFLNNDTIPQSGWLTALVEEAESHENVAVVGSKLLYPNGTIQHAGVVFSRTFFSSYHIYSGFPNDSPAVNQRREFQAVTAACMLVKREAFEAVGGMDEGYRNGFEDADLCLKIKSLGKKIIYQPSSVLYHLESQTEGRRNFEYLNGERFVRRWAQNWIEDEDWIVFEDGYVMDRQSKKNGGRQFIRHYTSPKERESWAKVAEVQRILHQIGDRTLQNVDATLCGRVRELLRQTDKWPNDQDVCRWAGWLSEKFDLDEQSVVFWQKAIAHEEDEAARAGLTRLALKKGKLEEANQHLRILLDEHPDSKTGLQLREEVEEQSQGAHRHTIYSTQTA